MKTMMLSPEQLAGWNAGQRAFVVPGEEADLPGITADVWIETIAPPFEWWEAAQEPLTELRAPCLLPGDHDELWHPCVSVFDGESFTIVATVSVEVLPVVATFAGGPRPAVRLLPQGLALVNRIEGEPPDMIDLGDAAEPVPGRDFAIVLTEVQA